MTSKTRKNSAEWHRRDVVAKWRASGLSQAEFCRREGIPEWALSEWKRREVKTKQEASNASAEKHTRGYGPPPKAHKDLERYWKTVVADQSRSSLPPAQFCREHGLRVHTLRRWKTRFAHEAATKQKSVAKENPFIAVRIPSAAAIALTDDAIEIALPGGSKVKVTERTSLDLLCKLLRKLEEEC